MWDTGLKTLMIFYTDSSAQTVEHTKALHILPKEQEKNEDLLEIIFLYGNLCFTVQVVCLSYFWNQSLMNSRLTLRYFDSPDSSSRVLRLQVWASTVGL